MGASYNKGGAQMHTVQVFPILEVRLWVIR
jgi:hypothetical protein